MAKMNGSVNLDEVNNDARMDKGTMGMGMNVLNDFRGSYGGPGGDRMMNDCRTGDGAGDVMLAQKARSPR